MKLLKWNMSVLLAGGLVVSLCGGAFAAPLALAMSGAGSGSGEGAAAAATKADGAPTGTANAAAIPEASGSSAGNDAINITPKEEVIYARLSAGGKVNDVYVVNVLTPAAPGKVTDFGTYTSVENLTDASGITQSGDVVAVEVSGTSLSYQGNMGAAALPWDVSVIYELDGKRVEATDLGGKSGKLSITVTTKRNASVDPAFFDNYLLQVTVPFVSANATDVATEDGQIALAGANTQITFTGMPGKDGTYKATATVTEFALGGISFAAVPFSMGIESPNTTELVSGFRQLGSGVGELKTGADGLATGASSLATGVGQVAGGVGELAAGAGELTGGASGLATGARGVASGLQGLVQGATGLTGGLAVYQGALIAQANDLRGQVADPAPQQQAYEQAAQTHTATFAGAYHAAKEQGLDDQAAAASAAAASAGQQAELQSALSAWMAVVGGNAGAQGAAGSLDGAAAGLGSAADAQSILGGATALSAGTSALTEGAAQLSDGADALAFGTSDFASGANQAAAGAGALSSGANQLSPGAQQLAEGTGTLFSEVQGMPDKVQQEIDAMMADYDKSNFKPVSFTSAKNTNIKLVQFVMATDAIEAPAKEAEPEVVKEETMWDRLLALFGIAA